jgi:regulator of sirC expression with transglutaminase-like and TPR domain
MLPPDDLESMLSRVSRSPVELMPEHLLPARDRAILVRMLVNLRGSFARRRDAVGMFRVLSRLLLLRPGHPEVLAERAVVRRDLLDLEGARADAEAAMALAASEEAPAARRARRVLKNLTLDRFSIH